MVFLKLSQNSQENTCARGRERLLYLFALSSGGLDQVKSMSVWCFYLPCKTNNWFLNEKRTVGLKWVDLYFCFGL